MRLSTVWRSSCVCSKEKKDPFQTRCCPVFHFLSLSERKEVKYNFNQVLFLIICSSVGAIAVYAESCFLLSLASAQTHRMQKLVLGSGFLPLLTVLYLLIMRTRLQIQSNQSSPKKRMNLFMLCSPVSINLKETWKKKSSIDVELFSIILRLNW